MSVKFIDSTKTTAVEKDGVIWYSNPVLNVQVTSDRRVFNNKTGRFLKPTALNLYSVTYSVGSGNSNPISYESLICHLLGFEKARTQKVELILPSNGYTRENIRLVTDLTPWRDVGKNRIGKKYKKRAPTESQTDQSSVTQIPVDLHLLETTIIQVEGFDVRAIDIDHLFVTEDDQKFKSKEEAEAHQLLVDKGKEMAQIVIEHQKGAYALAEKIFAKQVPVRKAYKNFIEMMSNDSGIVEIGANPTYKFVSIPEMGEFKGILNDAVFNTTEEVALAAIALRDYINASNTLLNLVVKQ